MKIDKLTKLKLQVNNNLNTIESIPAIDYNNGVFSAINHCCNKALELAVNGEINSNG